MTIFNQSQCFISALDSYATLKLWHDQLAWKILSIGYPISLIILIPDVWKALKGIGIQRWKG